MYPGANLTLNETDLHSSIQAGLPGKLTGTRISRESYIHQDKPGTTGELAMPHVIQAIAKQVGSVSIQAIKDLAPVLARLHKPHLAQRAHVMRNRRFAQADHFGQRADVLFAFGEDRNDAHAAGVAKSAEQLGDVRGGMFIQRGKLASAASSHNLIIEHLFRYSYFSEIRAVVKYCWEGPFAS